MNRIQLPVAIRTTAAALAVFMTVATLNTLVGALGPQRGELMAQVAARQAAGIASAPHHALVAQAPSESDH